MHPLHASVVSCTAATADARRTLPCRQEAFYGKQVTVADREMVESNVDAILRGADVEDVAFLVVGDPFG